MAKPVLYLTNDVELAIKELRPQMSEFRMPTMRGRFKSGDDFFIVLATERGDFAKFRGMEFSRYEIIGDRLAIHPQVIEYAKERVRP